MFRRVIITTCVAFFSVTLFAQKNESRIYLDSIAPAGLIKGLNDEQLLEIIQKQTFRFFWYGAHPLSGLALERNNTVSAEHYWDYINEAWGEPNFSKTTFGAGCRIKDRP